MNLSSGASDFIIRAAGITKSYATVSGPLQILQGVDLSINPGEIVAIVGQSGSGKSTLLHILGALDRPSGGTVHFGSQNIFALDDEALAKLRRHTIGFIFQFHNLLPEVTALDNVMMPRRIIGENLDDGVGVQLLEMVGLGSRLHHRPGELSGGEQQRVAMARSLINHPSLVLADEPTGSLDYQTGELVFKVFQEIQHEKNLTSILATHNVKMARRCNRIFRLESGTLQETSKDHV